MQLSPRNGDLAIAVLLLALAAFFLWGAWHMPAGTFAVPGPGIAPTALGVLLAVTAFALLVKTLTARRTEAEEPIPFSIVPVAIVSAALAAAAFAFERTGYHLTLVLFLFAMLRWFSRLGTVKSALAAIGITFVAGWFFGTLLGVNLPRGPW